MLNLRKKTMLSSWYTVDFDKYWKTSDKLTYSVVKN